MVKTKLFRRHLVPDTMKIVATQQAVFISNYYEEWTITNDKPRKVEVKIVQGPTMYFSDMDPDTLALVQSAYPALRRLQDKAFRNDKNLNFKEIDRSI